MFTCTHLDHEHVRGGGVHLQDIRYERFPAGGNLCTFIWMSFPSDRREQKENLLHALLVPPGPFPSLLLSSWSTIVLTEGKSEKAGTKYHNWESDLRAACSSARHVSQGKGKKDVQHNDDLSHPSEFCSSPPLRNSTFKSAYECQGEYKVLVQSIHTNTHSFLLDHVIAVLDGLWTKKNLFFSVHHLRQDCGPEAVRFFEQNLNEMSNSLIHRHCTSFTSSRCDEMMKKRGPVSESSSSHPQRSGGRKSKPLRSCACRGPKSFDPMFFRLLLPMLLLLLTRRAWLMFPDPMSAFQFFSAKGIRVCFLSPTHKLSLSLSLSRTHTHTWQGKLKGGIHVSPNTVVSVFTFPHFPVSRFETRIKDSTCIATQTKLSMHQINDEVRKQQQKHCLPTHNIIINPLMLPFSSI